MAKKRGKKAKAELVDAGPIVVPFDETATMILRELAELNDQALEAQREYLDLRDQTKDAKEAYDKLAEHVLTRLREATHASDLPLFMEVRESDQARMEAGPEAVPEAPSEPSGDDLRPGYGDVTPAEEFSL